MNEDMQKGQGNALFHGYAVDNQAIAIPETIEAIRALTEARSEGGTSIDETNSTPGIGTWR